MKAPEFSWVGQCFQPAFLSILLKKSKTIWQSHHPIRLGQDALAGGLEAHPTRKISAFICVICGLFFPSVLAAQIFTPETAAVQALRHNPDLAAARFAIHEAEGRLIQSGLWRNPEFEVGTDFDTKTRRGDRLVNLSLSQRFPLAGRLRKAREIGRVDVAMAIAEFQNQKRLLAGNVLAQARALLLLDRKIQLQDRQLTLLDRIQEQTTNLAANAQGDTASIGVVQLERATLALQRQSQLVTRQSALDSLNGLLGLSPGGKLQITGPLPPLPDFTTAPGSRSDLQLAALATDKALAEQRLARVEKWEDLSVGIGYTREKNNGVFDNMAQLKFSVPLPLWDRNQGRLAETRAAHERALADLAARQLAVATEIREAQNRATGLSAILAQTEGPLLTLARQNTALIEQTAASGSTSFLTIYESRRQHLNLSLAALDTRAALVGAITDWEMRTARFPSPVQTVLEGSLNEKLGIPAN